MKRIFSRVSGQVSLLIVLGCFLISFAISRATWPKRTVFATRVNLVVLHVLVADKQTGQPIHGLRAEDFEVFDNGEPTRIAYFRQGPKSDEEPVVLWLIAGCGQKGKLVQQRDGQADGADFLKSALESLNSADMVGVAHWCAEGDIAQVDLEPTKDREAAAIALNSAMRQDLAESRRRDGDRAVQKVLQLVHAATPSSVQALDTIVVFLDSDISKVSEAEAAQLAGGVLSHTSIVVDEIEEGTVAASKPGSADGIPLLPYLSRETGGQTFAVKGRTVGEALREIVDGLHSLYVLAFYPPPGVGEWHALRVKLANSAIGKHEGALLSYRSGYRRATPSDFYPVSEMPADTGHDFDAPLSQALKSAAAIKDIRFEADGATFEGSPWSARLSVDLTGEPLDWEIQTGGYDRSEITVVTAFFSAQGEMLQKKLKHYRVVRRKEDRWTAFRQSFHFFLFCDLPPATDRIRILIRDDASGKIGFQDLAMEKVQKAPRIRAVIAERKAADTSEVARLRTTSVSPQELEDVRP